MARPGVTEQEVIDAISSLMEIDCKITVENIRAELGRGSPNTINRYLREWRKRPFTEMKSKNIKELISIKKILLSQEKQMTLLYNMIIDHEKRIKDIEEE